MAANCKAPKKDKNEQEAHIVQDALIHSMNINAESCIIDLVASFHVISKRGTCCRIMWQVIPGRYT